MKNTISYKQIKQSILYVFILALMGCGGVDSDSSGDSESDTDSGTQVDDVGGNQLNGCVSTSSTDRTGEDAIELPWGDAHGEVQCNTVTVGTTVVWRVDTTLGDHNLKGGQSGEMDVDNPISGASPDFDEGTREVVFDTAGAYPYYCIGHPGDHMGVIYVVE